MSASMRAGSFVGKPLRRVEDPRFVRGEGSYIANMKIDGVAELAFVRSTEPHARIARIDTSAAATMPGVAGVFTAADLDLPTAAGPANAECVRHPLALDRVRFVGEPVAVVAAATAAQALDAAERVEVAYQPLPAVADAERALQADAPVLFDSIGSNRVNGMRSDVDALAAADVVVRCRISNQRVAVAPMESAVVAVLPGAGSGFDGDVDVTVFAGVQMPHTEWGKAAKEAGLSPERLRFVTPDMGGGFGGKTWGVEHQVAVAVARRLSRPVRWIETRSENMVTMGHGRDQVQYVEMGLRRDGTISGMRTRIVGNAGAYGALGGMIPMATMRNCAQGPYVMDRLAWEVAVAVTNTTPTGAYRGAGRPDAAIQTERLLDIGAAELGLDPAEIRRRNFIRPDAFPFTSHTGSQYDSGDYEKALDEALRLVDYERLRAEQAERIRSGATRVLGIGIASYIESSAPAIAHFGTEYASVQVHENGKATIAVGTASHGQGHHTTFAMIAAERLGIALDDIEFVQADTAVVTRGGGTVGSRSAQLAGSAVLQASDLLLDRVRSLVADRFEAAPEDIAVVGDGRIGVVGTPIRSATWGEVCAMAREQQLDLRVEHVFDQGAASFPFGTHVSVVEVDVETGSVSLLRHVAVDDCGTQINPMLVEGQVHGGVASGIAQALFEHFEYTEDAIPRTTTLMDYLMPSAADLPSFEVGHSETPSPLNPLGAKGVGESGTTGSTVAVQNAVVDALRPLGVRHLDMPCSPERVWRAIQDAREGRDGTRWRDPLDAFPTTA